MGPTTNTRTKPRRPSPFALLFVVPAAISFLSGASSAESGHPRVRMVEPTPGPVQSVRPARLAGHAIVNFGDLAAHQGSSGKEVRALVLPELEEPDEPVPSLAPTGVETPQSTTAASPLPSSSFMGLDDIPMADSMYITIPPDVGGAVGRSRVMSGHNNNYRIFDKSDGSVISTLGTATFWAPSGETALNALTDPRTLYDPYNDRWIAVMQTFATGAGNILVGVSQTGDPAGNWNLYRFATGATIDFPNVGFNKNWIVVSINRYSVAGSFQRGITLIVNYPLARAGTGSGVLVTQQPGTHFCSSPCVTYSATTDTLYLVTHLSSASGTYAIDTITGTPSSPSYSAGGTLTRPGGGWVQPSSQILPQSAPNAGASACGTPCSIETQDSQVRSAPVFRDGSIYYTQTVGLPSSGLAHTSAQWTRLGAPGGAFLDGGRIDDPTATSTNGGKWYAYPHIAVNAAGDFMVGYSQFSSAQHPAAGYSMHLAGDAAGTVRDPVVYKAGDDYYHKDFGSGRNRWGDFSAAQVDPSDDRSLWTLQEYAKARVNTNDGTSGANGSRWSTWWANVAGPAPTVTIAAGPSQDEGTSGTTALTFTVNLSTGYSLPVTVDYQTADGSATVADNDYQAATGSIVIPPGATSGTITVNVVGDTKVEPDETFTLGLVGATHGVLGSPSVSTATIRNDDVGYTITASAGTGGTIDPAGVVSVLPGASQSFNIAPNACYHVADVLVDGSSVGAVTTFAFDNIAASHTIDASFAPDLSVSIGEAVAYEGNSGTTQVDLPVQLSGTCSAPVDVTWKTVDGTATASSGDYVQDSTVVTFSPGEVLQHVSVQVNGDLTPEDEETFTVQLLGAVGAGLARSQGRVTILNDDGVTAVDESAPPRSLSFKVAGGNPVGDAVAFRLGLPKTAAVDLSIFDVQGRRIAVPLTGVLPAGYRTVPWSAKIGGATAGAGVYFARLRVEGRNYSRRFVLMH